MPANSHTIARSKMLVNLYAQLGKNN